MESISINKLTFRQVSTCIPVVTGQNKRWMSANNNLNGKQGCLVFICASCAQP